MRAGVSTYPIIGRIYALFKAHIKIKAHAAKAKSDTGSAPTGISVAKESATHLGVEPNGPRRLITIRATINPGIFPSLEKNMEGSPWERSIPKMPSMGISTAVNIKPSIETYHRFLET